MNCSDYRIPRGYRFNPSDEELLSDLEEKNRCNGSQITAIIPDIDVCKYEPRQLPELVFTKGESLGRKFFFFFFFWFIEKESWSSQRKWYFFTPRDYKYTNSTRSNRTTGEGFYKITGKNRAIRAPGSKAVIGWKRTLTFHLRGVPKPQRTGWVLHEYYLIQERSDPPKQIGDFVVCCLKYKSDNSDHDKDAPFCNRGSRSCSMASNAENQAEEILSSIEPVNIDPNSNGNEDEAETGGGMITEEEEEEDHRAYKELGHALQIPIGNPHALQDDLPTGQPEGNLADMMIKEMIEELLDDPDSLDSLLLLHDSPQLHQPHQSPMCTPDVHKDECRKRTYPFEDNDPSPLKKNNISTNYDDKQVSNSTSSSENQAANMIPEGYSPAGASGTSILFLSA
ncbi:protein NTM1-like 9 [Argentina anserina]|uniref:protein NTM1-like 9 n=1 Tax=Argentina anserina TaxID=57926 RepID=UPI0021767C81|nr:protein NTM1-like 9 [Potentilla anserina]XP_050387597.1 protein NTM1-like 9 [Potentilla anserina]